MDIKTTKTNVKPFVFVLMPFQSSFDDIYQLGIKAACLSVGTYCERVDEQIFVDDILERVYNQIAKADIIIAEMTGRNPNVFYETGYAHALKRRVILLTQNADDIPFDLKHYPHIVYGEKITQLKMELEKRLRWCIDNPVDAIVNLDLDFEFLVNEVTWQEDLKIRIPCFVETFGNAEEQTGNLRFSLKIVSHNISDVVIEGSRYHLGLITPSIFTVKRESDFETVAHNGSNTFIRFKDFKTVFPDEWSSVEIDFIAKSDDVMNCIRENKFILRLFSAFGTKDYEFLVDFFMEGFYYMDPVKI